MCSKEERVSNYVSCCRRPGEVRLGDRPLGFNKMDVTGDSDQHSAEREAGVTSGEVSERVTTGMGVPESFKGFCYKEKRKGGGCRGK